jgi:hypothetical protein
MNFILNHQYSDGNTPIRPEDAEQLIPKISTMKEPNEYEALNILEAQSWAFSNRTMNATNPLEESYVRTLYVSLRHRLRRISGAPQGRKQAAPSHPHWWLSQESLPTSVLEGVETHRRAKDELRDGHSPAPLGS